MDAAPLIETDSYQRMLVWPHSRTDHQPAYIQALKTLRLMGSVVQTPSSQDLARLHWDRSKRNAETAYAV